eukprot:g10052.t2
MMGRLAFSACFVAVVCRGQLMLHAPPALLEHFTESAKVSREERQDDSAAAWIAVIQPNQTECRSIEQLHHWSTTLRFPPCGLVLLEDSLPELIEGGVGDTGSSKSVEEELCVPGTFVSPDLPGFLCMAKASSASSASSALFAVAAALHCEDSWEFLELVLAKCMLATQEEACARLQRRELGLGGCFPLVERLPLRGEGLALRVGGWAYGGSLEADGVFNAVCSVLRLSDEKPPQCSDLWHWSGPGFYAQNVPLWPHSCAVLLLSFFIPIFWPLLWRCPCRACRCRGGLVGPAKMPRSLVTG